MRLSYFYEIRYCAVELAKKDQSQRESLLWAAVSTDDTNLWVEIVEFYANFFKRRLIGSIYILLNYAVRHWFLGKGKSIKARCWISFVEMRNFSIYLYLIIMIITLNKDIYYSSHKKKLRSIKLFVNDKDQY